MLKTQPAEIQADVRAVLRLAWPTVLSFVCNSAYRVNDQFWVGGLGPDAQAALGASVFLLILNFAFFFLAVSGSLPLVARATGAGDATERDHVVRHALVLGSVIALVLGCAGYALSAEITDWMGISGRTAELTAEYLGTIYLLALPLALAPVVDTFFIGMGNTLVPFLLQIVAVATNFVLNPCLIYGYGPFEAHGIAGAAIATCVSRGIAVVLGLYVLRRFFGVQWARGLELAPRRFLEILRTGVPSSVAIAVYAIVYFALIRLVITPLGRDVLAGLGVGFNAFEGVSFPFFLGIAVAGSSLVGRSIGARRPERALQAVSSVRRVSAVLGLFWAAIFYFVAPALVPAFTTDPGVHAEAVLYLRVLAFSQFFVALETANEKVLLGSGHTGPIFWISGPGNLLRVPLAMLFAFTFGFGAQGVWWAINVTTLLKAGAYTWMVEKRTWLGPLRGLDGPALTQE